jgi:uncharacterized protein YbjQ (UPF0145 family)
MASPWSRASGGMIVTTTAMVEGRPVKDYLGIVTGEVIVGANLFRDLFASITDLDYEVLGSNGSMLMVSVSGTAVVL